MDTNQPEGLPQWAVNGLIWVVVTTSSIITGVLGWFTRKYIVKVDRLEEHQGKFATKVAMAELEQRIPGLVSRTEFLSYMSQLRDETEKRNDQMRDDRARMHRENIDSIHAVHTRVDDLFKELMRGKKP